MNLFSEALNACLLVLKRESKEKLKLLLFFQRVRIMISLLYEYFTPYHALSILFSGLMVMRCLYKATFCNLIHSITKVEIPCSSFWALSCPGASQSHLLDTREQILGHK